MKHVLPLVRMSLVNEPSPMDYQTLAIDYEPLTIPYAQCPTISSFTPVFTMTETPELLLTEWHTAFVFTTG